jgi:DNA-binding MarR family transcriptional regulator
MSHFPSSPEGDDSEEDPARSREERAAERDAFLRLTESLLALLAEQLLATPEMGQISLVHLQMLYWLEERSPFPLHEAVHTFSMSPVLTRRVIRKLVRYGWVKRCGDMLDRHIVYLNLTPSGALFLARVAILQQRRCRKLLDGLSPEERRLLARGLGFFRENDSE